MHETYPALFAPITWPDGPIHVQFEIGAPPSEHLISNVNAVPCTRAGQWIVIQLADGSWEIPGGTVEENEAPYDALVREVLEEAGARVQSAQYLGALKMHSLAEQPFRPHLPHPISYRAVYLCQVELVGPPQIPESGGEQVVAVQPLSLAEAVARFEQIERFDLADLYRYAAGQHSTGTMV